MKFHRLSLFLVATVAFGAPQAFAVSLSPADINGGDSSTTSFTDGSITLTPFIGAAPSTFNANPTRLGNDDQGTNASAFNDPDTDPNNGNEETLEFQFSPLVGLSQIAFDFSRADGPGPDSGVSISGFASNPFVSFFDPNFGGNPGFSSTYDGGTGTVSFDLPFALAFVGQDIEINFASPNASAGQTLLLRVTDEDEAGAQLAITNISYEAIPEPASLSLLAIGFAAVLRRQR